MCPPDGCVSAGTAVTGSSEDRPDGEPRVGRGAWKAPVFGFAVFFMLSGGLVALFGDRLSQTAIEQPIAFSHRRHVVELEMDCSTCHPFYEKEAFSGLPEADVCAACHSEPQGKSAEEARLVRLLGRGEPLEWRGLFRQPAHVFYSHRRHVAVAKIACAACHGQIAEAKAPPGRVRPLAMEDCVGCHRQRGVGTDCTTCHR